MPLPHAVSFEDLRRHRDHQLSSKRSTDSYSNMRRTKSDTDVALQSLKKKVEASKSCRLQSIFLQEVQRMSVCVHWCC